MSELSDYFNELEDPRAGNAHYRLGDLLVLMVAASLCGAETASDFALFAQTRMTVLNRLVPYTRAPSHDTFSRLLRLLDPESFGAAFALFAAGFAKALGERGLTPNAAKDGVVAIDGKALRRAYERGLAHYPPLMVSAFATGTKLCLAASSADEDNEVEAALRVVEMLDLTGRIITGDALHCHHRMGQAVFLKKGDYVLALKANRHDWWQEAKRQFNDNTGKTSTKTHAKEHDRFEWRKAEVIAAEKPLMAGHMAFIRVTSARNSDEPFTRYFMASQLFTAKQAMNITRSHWQIENNLHWMLDVHLGEDDNRARKDNAPPNIAILKRLARNILQIADKPKVPISHRIKKCAWDNNYLINALAQMR